MYEGRGDRAKAAEAYQRALTAVPGLARGRATDSSGSARVATLRYPSRSSAARDPELGRQRERDDRPVHLIEPRQQLEHQSQQRQPRHRERDAPPSAPTSRVAARPQQRPARAAGRAG